MATIFFRFFQLTRLDFLCCCCLVFILLAQTLTTGDQVDEANRLIPNVLFSLLCVGDDSFWRRITRTKSFPFFKSVLLRFASVDPPPLDQ